MTDYVNIPQAMTRKEYLRLEIRRLQSELAEIEARGFSTSVVGFPLWTTEFPTKPGFYWIRNYQTKSDSSIKHRPALVEVFSLGGMPKVWLLQRTDLAIPREHLITAEWYGPIEPPE